jgi:hypothetical protein
MCRLEAFVRFYMERGGIKYDRGVDQTEARVLGVSSIWTHKWTHELGVVSVHFISATCNFNTL